MRRIFYLAVVCLIAVLISAETAVAHETSRTLGTTIAPGGVVTEVTGGFAVPLTRTPTREVTVAPGQEDTRVVRATRITVIVGVTKVTVAPGEEVTVVTLAPGEEGTAAPGEEVPPGFAALKIKMKSAGIRLKSPSVGVNVGL